jgi:protein-S-isoprenylcysteine O-methyltransferase Ste14
VVPAGGNILEGSKTESARGGKQRRAGPLTRNLSLIGIGTVLLLGGVLMILAFGLATRTGDLMNFIAKNAAFQSFFVAIGVLIGIVGVIVTMAGWHGAKGVLSLLVEKKKGETYDSLFQGTVRSHAEDFTKK